mgnify:CR=1 FL=1
MPELHDDLDLLFRDRTQWDAERFLAVEIKRELDEQIGIARRRAEMCRNGLV